MSLHLHLVSTSLRPGSLSRRLLFELVAPALERAGATTACTDMADLPPVLCDGRDLADYPPAYAELVAALEAADGCVWACPVYCYSVSGASKNLLDIVGRGLTAAPVAIVSASGSPRSHLAARHLVEAMADEFGALVLPGQVQVSNDLEAPDLAERVEAFACSVLDHTARVRALPLPA